MKRLPDTEQITAFLTVAEELSFKRAAERLFIDHSALSRRIKDLEQRIGFPLFFRTTHSVRLTEAGRSFYDSNFKILESLNDAVDTAGRIARGSQGVLRIAYMTFAAIELMPEAVREHSSRFPDVFLNISFLATQRQKLALSRDEIDVGLLLGPFVHPDFETLEVSAEEPIALMAADSPLAANAELTLRDVEMSPLIFGDLQQWADYRQIIERVFAKEGCHCDVKYEAPGLFGVLGLVRAGLGITVAPKVMEQFCPRGVVCRPITGVGQAFETIAAWRRPAENKVNDFVSTLKSVIAVRTLKEIA